jgi:hypothetical protein
MHQAGFITSIYRDVRSIEHNEILITSRVLDARFSSVVLIFKWPLMIRSVPPLVH